MTSEAQEPVRRSIGPVTPTISLPVCPSQHFSKAPNGQLRVLATLANRHVVRHDCCNALSQISTGSKHASSRFCDIKKMYYSQRI